LDRVGKSLKDFTKALCILFKKGAGLLGSFKCKSLFEILEISIFFNKLLHNPLVFTWEVNPKFCLIFVFINKYALGEGERAEENETYKSNTDI
jgi:hypothetical protein